MRSIKIVFAVMLFVLTAELQAQEVTFQQKPYVAGIEASSFEHKHISMDVDIDAGGSIQTMKFSEKDTLATQLKILEVRDGYPVVYSLKVVTFESEKIQAGKTDKSTHPCSGKSYILNFKDSVAVFEAEDGHELSEEELKYLREKSRPEDKMKLAEAISGKTFVPGQHVDSIAALAESFRELLKEVREINSVQCGVFDFQMTVENSNDQMEMTVDMYGEMIVTVDGCFPVRMSMKGDMLGVASSGASVTFNGDIDFWAEYHYSE